MPAAIAFRCVQSAFHARAQAASEADLQSFFDGWLDHAETTEKLLLAGIGGQPLGRALLDGRCAEVPVLAVCSAAGRVAFPATGQALKTTQVPWRMQSLRHEDSADLVVEAPVPSLGRVAAFDRMADRLDMFRGVPKRRLVAAADVSAGSAHARMHPLAAALRAFLASPRRCDGRPGSCPGACRCSCSPGVLLGGAGQPQECTNARCGGRGSTHHHRCLKRRLQVRAVGRQDRTGQRRGDQATGARHGAVEA